MEVQMSVAAKIDRLVEKYGHANADDVSRQFAIVSDEHGYAAFWKTTGYSDARTGGLVSEANLTGNLFTAIGSQFYGPRDRDETLALCDRLIPLNEKARWQIIQLRNMIGAPEEIEVAA